MKSLSGALTIKPITLKAANDFVKQYHRHNLPTVGCKFAIACYNSDKLCGVAICGRPTARNADDGKTVEIYRNCTDGTYNACSKLYGACVKVAKNMGYERVITYILDSENGASVLASNFTFDGRAGLPEQTGSRQKSRAVAPKEYKKRYVYNIVPPNGKEDKIMVWDGKALSNIVKECLYDIFAHEIDDNALIMSNKDYADLLKKKHNNSGHSCLDKSVYIHTRSNGIEICFKDGFDKTLLKELDDDNALVISWSMAARHIRAWQTEKKLSAADQSEVETKSKIQNEYDTSHLCGSPYNQDHCSFLLYATEKNVEYNGKPLEQYCVYCTENGKARKIGQMSTWTGLTPKFCSKRKAAENKKEESQMPSFDFSELSGTPDFNFAAFTSQDNQLKMIPLDMLDYNNDYERYDGERYSDMVESIKKNGILQPLIVRSQPDGRFYILAGNNRRYCGEAAGVQMFPCIVKENLTDEEAQAYIDETNVYQRGFSSLKITKQAEVIARRHSQMFDEEKLKAIRREIAMMNGEEFPEDQGGDKLSKLAQVGQEYGLGKDSIARLIRINELVPELKPFVDNGTIAVRTAVNLSYLFVSEQKKVAEMITDGGYSVDMKKSAVLKEISAQKQLNDKMIEAIVSGKYNPDAKPPKPKAFKIKSEIAAKYFAPDWDNDKVQEVIAAALEMYYNYDVSAEIGRRTGDGSDEQEDG